MTTVDLQEADIRARIERVRAARAAALAAAAAEEQAVRDVLADRKLPVARLTREAYGSDNRQRIYAMLGRGADGGEPTEPPLTPVVYLRGAGMPDWLWTEIEQAMWARGWATTRDRGRAWYLARGGVPVALCDFSADQVIMKQGTDGATLIGPQLVYVGRIRARYQERPADDDGSPHHEFFELVVSGDGPQLRPELPDHTPDVQAIARLVADALA